MSHMTCSLCRFVMRGISLSSDRLLVADKVIDIIRQISGIGCRRGLASQIGHDLTVDVGEGCSRAYGGIVRLERTLFRIAASFELTALGAEVDVDTGLLRGSSASSLGGVTTHNA